MKRKKMDIQAVHGGAHGLSVMRSRWHPSCRDCHCSAQLRPPLKGFAVQGHCGRYVCTPATAGLHWPQRQWQVCGPYNKGSQKNNPTGCLREGRRKTKVKANVHVCTRERQKNEDMTRGWDGTKVYVVVMKGEPSAQGQTMKPTSL